MKLKAFPQTIHLFYQNEGKTSGDQEKLIKLVTKTAHLVEPDGENQQILAGQTQSLTSTENEPSLQINNHSYSEAEEFIMSTYRYKTE